MSTIREQLQSESPELFAALERSAEIADKEWLAAIPANKGSYNSYPHIRSLENHLDQLCKDIEDLPDHLRVHVFRMNPTEKYMLLAAILFHDFGRTVPGAVCHASESQKKLSDAFAHLGLPNKQIADSLGRICHAHDPEPTTRDEVWIKLQEINIAGYGVVHERPLATLLLLLDQLDTEFTRVMPLYLTGNNPEGSAILRSHISGTRVDIKGQMVVVSVNFPPIDGTIDPEKFAVDECAWRFTVNDKALKDVETLHPLCVAMAVGHHFQGLCKKLHEIVGEWKTPTDDAGKKKDTEARIKKIKEECRGRIEKICLFLIRVHLGKVLSEYRKDLLKDIEELEQEGKKLEENRAKLEQNGNDLEENRKKLAKTGILFIYNEPLFAKRTVIAHSPEEDVKWIQRALHIRDDGIFGPETKKAVAKFHKVKQVPGGEKDKWRTAKVEKPTWDAFETKVDVSTAAAILSDSLAVSFDKALMYVPRGKAGDYECLWRCLSEINHLAQRIIRERKPDDGTAYACRKLIKTEEDNEAHDTACNKLKVLQGTMGRTLVDLLTKNPQRIVAIHKGLRPAEWPLQEVLSEKEFCAGDDIWLAPLVAADILAHRFDAYVKAARNGHEDEDEVVKTLDTYFENMDEDGWKVFKQALLHVYNEPRRAKRPVAKGSNSRDIQWVQRHLKLDADGAWNNEICAKVKEHQKKKELKGIDIYGEVDEETWESFEEKTSDLNRADFTGRRKQWLENNRSKLDHPQGNPWCWLTTNIDNLEQQMAPNGPTGKFTAALQRYLAGEAADILAAIGQYAQGAQDAANDNIFLTSIKSLCTLEAKIERPVRTALESCSTEIPATLVTQIGNMLNDFFAQDLPELPFRYTFANNALILVKINPKGTSQGLVDRSGQVLTVHRVVAEEEGFGIDGYNTNADECYSVPLKKRWEQPDLCLLRAADFMDDSGFDEQKHSCALSYYLVARGLMHCKTKDFESAKGKQGNSAARYHQAMLTPIVLGSARQSGLELEQVAGDLAAVGLPLQAWLLEENEHLFNYGGFETFEPIFDRRYLKRVAGAMHDLWCGTVDVRPVTYAYLAAELRDSNLDRVKAAVRRIAIVSRCRGGFDANGNPQHTQATINHTVSGWSWAKNGLSLQDVRKRIDFLRKPTDHLHITLRPQNQSGDAS